MPAETTRIEAVDIAQQLERCGEAYYAEACRHARDKAVRELLGHLRDEEAAHRRTFEGLLGGVDGAEGGWRHDEGYQEWMRGFAARRVFPDAAQARDFARSLPSDRELLDRAIAFELQTVEFLEQLRDRVRPEDRAVIDELIAEEREHERLLRARRRRLAA